MTAILAIQMALFFFVCTVSAASALAAHSKGQTGVALMWTACWAVNLSAAIFTYTNAA
jgi:hypothetical protein